MDNTLTAEKTENIQAIRGSIEPQPELSKKTTLTNLVGIDEVDKKLREMFLAKHYQQVKKSLKKAENPRSLFALGEIYLLKKQFNKAKELFLKALSYEPELLKAYDNLIFIAFVQKDRISADKYYKNLIKVSKNRVEIVHNYILFRLGLFLDDKNTTDECLSLVKEILDKEPANPFILNTYGFILLNFVNNVSLAADQFKKAASINEKLPDPINNLAVCYLREKKFEKAEQLLQKTLALNKTYASAYQNLASGYISTHRYDKALEMLNKAVSNNARISEDWEHKIGWLLLELNKITEAEEWYVNRIKLEPSNDLLYNNLGYCEIRLNKISNALSDFKKAVELVKKSLKNSTRKDTRSLLAFYNLGRMAIDRYDDKLLYEICTDILRIKGDDPFGLYLLGVYHVHKNEYSRAKKLFVEALDINEKIPEVYADLSFIYTSIDKDYKSAIELLNKAKTISSVFAVLVDNNLAFAYIKNGKLEKAKKVLEQYREPEPAIILATKGLYYIKLGDIEKGNQYYNKASQIIKPNNKNLVNQIWLYEQAAFWLDRKDLNKAKEQIIKAKKLGKSYMADDLMELEKKIKSSETT